MSNLKPTILPLGDSAMLVRFAQQLDMDANREAIALARRLENNLPFGVTEIAPNLVSVLVRYNSSIISYAGLSGELRLIISDRAETAISADTRHEIEVNFGGEAGADLPEVAHSLGMNVAAFVAAHNQHPLRVLATGFAPGFVYCGLHDDALTLPRKREVRASVPAGTILFAANQTAITATSIPTGWHVIGRTDFNNFDLKKTKPTLLSPGDYIVFRDASK